LFAGLYLDRIADLVEAIHYPQDAPGRAPSALTALASGLNFTFVALIINVVALPFLLFAVGAAVMLTANAYLLSREYFEMASLRHMSKAAARELRQTNRRRVFLSGFIPAALALVPVLNLLLPLFATSYFIHVFKGMAPASSAGTGTDR
jgi:CysZ protein